MRDLTVTDLASLVHSNPQHVGRVLRGHVKPSQRLRESIADVLGAGPSDLFEDAMSAVAP